MENRIEEYDTMGVTQHDRYLALIDKAEAHTYEDGPALTEDEEKELRRLMLTVHPGMIDRPIGKP